MEWKPLRAAVSECRRCELSEHRTQAVFGVGDRDADVVFISEGPGYEEDKQGEPFVGPAGQLLNAMLKSINLGRERGVYIANIVKCHHLKIVIPNHRKPRHAC